MTEIFTMAMKAILAMAAIPMTLATFDLNAVARIATLRSIDCLIEGTLIAMFAVVVLRVARRQSSATRFAVWFAALVAIAALPLVGGAGWLSSLQAGQQAGISSGALNKAAIVLPASWPLYLLVAWAGIAGFLLLRVARGVWHLHVLRKSCVPVDVAALDERVKETLARSQAARRVDFCTSDRVQVPTAIGLVKPAVVVPTWVMQELSSEELNQIVLHELAHLNRWDDWTNLAQKIVGALFFFHPAVWWIEKQVSLEREMACDDAVVEATASPRAYAECLAHLAEKTLIQRSVALAQAALGRVRQTSLRVAQILDANRNANRSLGTGRGWRPAVAMVGAFALACVVGVSRAPRLVAFSDSVPDRPAISANAVAVSDFGISPGSTQMHLVKASASQAGADECVRRHVGPVSRGQQNFVRAEAKRARTSIIQANLRRSQASEEIPVAIPVTFTTETLFVVVQGNENGSPSRPLFQIEMWRVMVLHSVVNADSNRIPAKQT
ncbi:MAG TPA: M56 family metallopeptidase [Candidatus Sulfotelmatobacter sp.]